MCCPQWKQRDGAGGAPPTQRCGLLGVRRERRQLLQAHQAVLTQARCRGPALHSRQHVLRTLRPPLVYVPPPGCTGAFTVCCAACWVEAYVRMVCRGTANKDFLCVQSMDGQLSFFEQDHASFTRQLKNCMLPGPICYCDKTDSIITASSELQVESYKCVRAVAFVGGSPACGSVVEVLWGSPCSPLLRALQVPNPGCGIFCSAHPSVDRARCWHRHRRCWCWRRRWARPVRHEGHQNGLGREPGRAHF